MSKSTPSIVRRGWVKESDLPTIGYEATKSMIHELRKDEHNARLKNGEWEYRWKGFLDQRITDREAREGPIPGIHEIRSLEKLRAQYPDYCTDDAEQLPLTDARAAKIAGRRMTAAFLDRCPALDRALRYVRFWVGGKYGFVNVYHRDDLESIRKYHDALPKKRAAIPVRKLTTD